MQRSQEREEAIDAAAAVITPELEEEPPQRPPKKKKKKTPAPAAAAPAAPVRARAAPKPAPAPVPPALAIVAPPHPRGWFDLVPEVPLVDHFIKDNILKLCNILQGPPVLHGEYFPTEELVDAVKRLITRLHFKYRPKAVRLLRASVDHRGKVHHASFDGLHLIR